MISCYSDRWELEFINVPVVIAFAPVPPYIDSELAEEHQNVINGEVAQLNCPVNGIPAPTITWLKSGQPVQTNGRIHQLDDAHKIEISLPEEADTALYTCIGLNVAGSTQLIFNLTVFGASFYLLKISFKHDYIKFI